MKLRTILAALMLSVLLTGAAIGPARAAGVDAVILEDPAQETQARALMREIRCLVCPGESIADSNAELAVDLRALVRSRMAAGESPDQIKTWLLERYGDAILLRPPLHGGTLLLWGAPLLFLLIGALAARRLFAASRPDAS